MKRKYPPLPDRLSRCTAGVFGHLLRRIADPLVSLVPALYLAAASWAQAYPDLASAYAAVGFDPRAPGNAVVVVFTDQHMCLDSTGMPAPVDTTNFDVRFINAVNSMDPPPARMLGCGDVSSSLSVVPGTDGLFYPEVAERATNEMKLFAAGILQFTNIAQTNILFIPGNHDQVPQQTDADVFRSVFPNMPPYQTFDLAGVRFFLINEGNYGEPSDSEREWLLREAAATSPTQQIAVIAHQPPFHGTVIHRGGAVLLKEAFGHWQVPWWVFDGHEHSPAQEVFTLGDTNVAQFTLGPASTNTFMGYTYGCGCLFLCLSNGIQSRIYYRYRSDDYLVIGEPTWYAPTPFVQAFENVPGLLWRRLKSHTPLPEVLVAKSTDSWDWWAYPTDLELALPLGQHANQATHFLLLLNGLGMDAQLSFSADRTNWVPVTFPDPTNFVYSIPIPAEFAGLPTAYVRFTGTNGNDFIGGWGLSTTNDPPWVTYPQMPTIADQPATAEQTLWVTNSALDPYSPPDILNYILLDGPAGGKLNPATGLFHWRPQQSQAGQTFGVTVKVSDRGTPVMSATNHFTIRVEAALDPRLQVVVSAKGVILDWSTDWTGFALESSPTPYGPWSYCASEPPVVERSSSKARFYRLTGPAPTHEAGATVTR